MLAGKDAKPAERFAEWTEQVKLFGDGLAGTSSSADELIKILETAGPSAMVATAQGMKSAGDAAMLYRQNILNTIGVTRELADEQLKAAADEMARIKDLDVDPAEKLKQMTKAQKMYAEGLATRTKVEGLVVQYIKLGTAELEVQLTRVKELTELHKTDLEISKGVYGVAGLSVQAYKKVVSTLQEQKDIVADQLRQHLVDLEQTKEGSQARMDAMEKVRKKQLEHNRLTAEQVNMLKELRDGYLDAVQAQAFGAGAFEKILITQEKNLGKGMDKGLVKQNLMLGAIEDRARASNVLPSRFSSTGYGVETLSGEAVEGDLLRDQMNQLSYHTDQFGAVMMGMATNTAMSVQSMGRIPGSADAASRAFDNFSRRLGAGGLAPGTKSADTYTGDLMRHGASGVPGAPRPAPVPGSGYDYSAGNGAGSGTNTGTRTPPRRYGSKARGDISKIMAKACDLLVKAAAEIDAIEYECDTADYSRSNTTGSPSTRGT